MSNNSTISTLAQALQVIAKNMLESQQTPEQIREYIRIQRKILDDLEKAVSAPVATTQVEPVTTPEVKPEPKQAPAPKVEPAAPKAAARVKRTTKRDIEPDAAERIDATKAVVSEYKPEKVAQSKGVTKKSTPKAEKAQGKRTHEGMSYSEVRSQVSTRKAKLNKADQDRMSKAGLKNNTWEGAIASLEWLNKYFPTK